MAKKNLIDSENIIINSQNDNINLDIAGLENLTTEEKVNIVRAINEVNNKFEWNYLGETTGNQQITLPNDWKELYATTAEGTMLGICINFYVPRIVVEGGQSQFRTGFYITSGITKGASIYFRNNTSTCELLESYTNGTSVIATQKTKWFYK